MEAYAVSIETAYQEAFGVTTTEQIFGGKWTPKPHGRAPYTDGWEKPDCGMTMWASPHLRHMTIEFSGQGCEWLESQGFMDIVLRRIAERVTRIDVATDILTGIAPSQFVGSGVSARFSGRGVYTSQTGETVYVGSQKSERFARVYRYAPPHPRSNLLRVEHVSRRDFAKVVARELVNSSIEVVASMLGKSFGWRDETWTLRNLETNTLSLVRPERAGHNTARWLITSVAPAFKRLVKEGIIPDPEAFVQAYFLQSDELTNGR